MTEPCSWIIRKASPDDLVEIKRLCDQHRNELGFVLRPALVASIEANEILVADEAGQVIGFVHYHHRRDLSTTIYHIAVATNARRNGVGRTLIEALRYECMQQKRLAIRLKCPTTLPVNEFYKQIGFVLIEVDKGKRRSLNLWLMRLNADTESLMTLDQ